ncbi:patatin-like phospholipase family protein [Candidatus Pacearchaeota archaeon]|nr:patatin-like phospholipase family protein [Candidatus Pacearchaeota archaeon]
MKKSYHLGIFLEGGGIRTFYGGGVIDGLKKVSVKPDFYCGISASAGTIFGNMFNCNKAIIDIFGKKCNNNSKNFYFFRKPHFPHNAMMEGALLEIFKKHIKNPNNKEEWGITSGITPKDNSYLKTHLVLYLMVLKNVFHINLFKIFRRIFEVKEERVSSDNNLSSREIVNFIMGSSSIYPFIKPHYYMGKLLLEANCLDLDYEKCLSDCKKGIIIYNREGKSYIKDNILHFYSSQKLEWNILDYTSKEKLQELRKIGISEAKKQKEMIKKFIF